FGFGVGEKVEITRRGSILGNGVADDFRGRGKSRCCRWPARFLARGVDWAWNWGSDVSGSLRIVERIHRVYLASRTCPHVEGLYLCLRESRSGRVPGLASAA